MQKVNVADFIKQDSGIFRLSSSVNNYTLRMGQVRTPRVLQCHACTSAVMMKVLPIYLFPLFSKSLTNKLSVRAAPSMIRWYLSKHSSAVICLAWGLKKAIQ